jgi:SAM-dependent methyltransferase
MAHSAAERTTVDGPSQTAKAQVHRHYEEYGWRPVHDGRVAETRFVDSRPVMTDYYRESHARAGSPFAAGGRYFVDAGCGGQPMVDYGQAYRRHVCVDFSPLGLAQARQRLGSRGLYVVADIVRLPFKPGVFDGGVNAYSLFHVPREEQAHAVRELARVMRPGAPGALLYGRAYSRLWSTVRTRLVRQFPALRTLKRRMLGIVAPPPEMELYFFTFPPRWFRRLLGEIGVRETDIRCLRILDERMTRRLVPDNGLGRAVVRVVQALERRWPRLLAPLAANYVVSFRK